MAGFQADPRIAARAQQLIDELSRFATQAPTQPQISAPPPVALGPPGGAPIPPGVVSEGPVEAGPGGVPLLGLLFLGGALIYVMRKK